MSNRRVFVLDDEQNITFVVKAILEKGGFEVSTFNEPAAALQALQASRDCGVFITDLHMPGMSGMDVMSRVREIAPEVPVVMITAFGTVDSAVAALKKGAFDYITKPFDQGELVAIVTKALNTCRLRGLEPSGGQQAGQAGSVPPPLLVGKSPQIAEVLRIARKIARSPSTVLISGESGTGKELVAMEIHRSSDRADKPFIKINCAAIPHNLIESELFGYEKGAFTGAVNSKPGRFELAHEGTLFLDEIAEMPLEMQVKLLRAIQEQEFERVGGLQTIKINVRLIAATNKDIQKEVREGRFREDLYYRLNVVPLLLAPLRERREDIEDLAFCFVRKFNERLGKRVETVDPQCLRRLREYSWPGNIRQLENVLERSILMAEDNILKVSDLPPELGQECGDARAEPVSTEAIRALQSGGSYKEVVKRQTQLLERDLIERALAENDGNITKTAERLGLSRKGLQLKLKEIGIRGGDGSE